MCVCIYVSIHTYAQQKKKRKKKQRTNNLEALFYTITGSGLLAAATDAPEILQDLIELLLRVPWGLMLQVGSVVGLGLKYSSSMDTPAPHLGIYDDLNF